MQSRIHFSVATAILCLLGSFAGSTRPLHAEGVTLHQKQTTSGTMGQSESATSTLFYGEQAMKQSNSDGSDFIIDFTGQKTIIVDHNEKTYTETTFEQMKSMLEQLNAEMTRQKDQMSEQLKGNPEAAKMLGQMTAGEVTVANQGDGGTIAGYSTQKYAISMPPMMQIELWSAPDLKVPEAYYDALKLQTAGGNPFIDMGKLLEAMKQVEGLSIKTVVTMNMMGMNMTSTTETTRVEKGDLPESVFAIPAGYTKTEMKSR